jgi:5-methylcytosine-specific restriction endonuclease McrA
MRIELWILLATALVIVNIYTEGKYLKLATQYKKYYQMAGIAVVGLFLYFMVKRNPLSWGPMLATTNDYLKYMPIDKGTSQILSPILDFTTRQSYQREQSAYGGSVPVLPVDHLTPQEQKIRSSGLARPGQKVKRSVSETKKKFVAARQGWKCGDCQLQLNAWFEVDHKIRLEHGGSNHIDNLVALCRDCHGKKTTIENL